MKTTWFIGALSISMVCSMAAQVTPSLVTNLPADGRQRHTIYASPIPAEEPVTEPPSFFPTNGPSLTDFGVGASSPVRQEIRLLEDGAIADYGLLTVLFPAEITEAPVTIITPDGRKLSVRPTFLALYDNASGKSFLLSEVKPSIGELVGDNTVVYPQALDGGAIRYRYTKYSLEQDVILTEAIPQLPDELHDEFQAENVVLEVWSELIDSTPDTKESQTIELRPQSGDGTVPAVVAADEQAKFGAARIGDGFAFGIQTENEKIPVAKTFTRIGQRDWLIERADFSLLKPALDKLPKRQASLSPERIKSDRTRLVRSLYARTDSKPSGKTMRLAQATPPKQNSLVLDFIIVSAAPAPADIISWWPGGNTNDVIGANHVAFSNGATNSAGKVGQGFSLDGVNDRITALDSATLDFGAGQDFSLEAWIKPLTNITTFGVATILSKRYSPGAGTLGYELYLANGVLGLRMDDPGNLYAFQASSGDLRADGNFHHVAATVDRDSTNGLKLYVDGSVVATFNPTVVPGDLSNSEPWRIGNHPTPGLNCFFKGIIDEPAVYGRALGESEIQAIYNAGVAGKIDPTCVTAPTNIVAWWPGDGNTYDLARTNFATLSGATYESAVTSQGFSFDGVNDGVTAADDNALNLATTNDQLTVEAWIKPLTNTTTFGVMSVVGKRYTPNGSTSIGYEMFVLNGVPGFQIMNLSGVATFTATNHLRDGSYHHVAATLDRTSTNGGKIYVDGIPVLTFNPTVLSGSLSNHAPVRIGVHPQPGFNGWYKGIIDEPTIYRRALSGAEITSLYAAGSAGKCKTDTDSDGLTDLQETFLGTNASDTDSDDDGLSDGDEVFVHQTNPNDADTDDDSLPDGWEWNHFGGFAQDENGDYDNDGVNNGTEYANGSDPNTLQFGTRYDNLYVSNRTVNGSCEILGGVPAFIAVLVNSTNLTGVTWQAYNSNFNATLPDADGEHTVFVALRGRTTGFPPAWDETQFTLDRVPPVLQITNPASASATVIKPYLQLKGLANEPLASLVYDLTNAAGLLTNESAFVVDQYFDTNQFDFTTNFFQAYDVELTNGLNTIKLTVSDLAGNVTITNLNVTLDYTTATNPPVMQLVWPTNNAHLSGSAFFVRGWINDETANVKAQIVAAGVTNEFPGLVERNGTFWVEDLPLVSGTNLVTLVAEDAAGNLSNTNLSVVKSSVTLAITSTPEGESLYQPFGTVAGTVSNPSYSVTVNGVAATVDGSGNWQAENVPVFGRGTAIFEAVATASGGGSPPVAAAVEAEMPAYIEVVKHESNKSVRTDGPGENFSEFKRTKNYSAGLKPGPDGNWITSFNGTATDSYDHNSGWEQNIYQWSATSKSTVHTDYVPDPWSSANILNDTYGEITGVPDKDVLELGQAGGPPPIFVHHYYASGVRHEWKNPDGSTTTATVEAPLTQLKLYAGGKAGIKRKNLIQINASAQQYGKSHSPPSNTPWLHTPTEDVQATKIQVLGKQLGNDGRLYIVLPDGAEEDLNLRVPGPKHYGAWAFPTKHKLRITANGTPLDPEEANAQFCVGQKVTFAEAWDQYPPGVESSSHDWLMSADFVNEKWQRSYQDPEGGEIFYGSVNYRINQVLLKQESTSAWWVDGGQKNCKLTLNLVFDNGQRATAEARGKFTMYRPSVAMVNPAVHGTPQNIWLTGPPPWSGLEFGRIGLGHQEGPNNMSFTVRIISSDFAGEAKITQLCTIDATHYPLDINISNQLDNEDPYPSALNQNIFKNPNPQGHMNIVGLDDAPENAGFGHFHFNGSFVDYVMFTPGGAEDIFVTLGKITWSTSFGGTYPSSSISPNSVTGPTGPDASDEFPTWTEVWSNPN